MDKIHLNKSQRMQIKALICILGMLFFLLLFLLKLILAMQPEEQEKEIHIPVIEYLTNVWIMDADEEGILIFREGVEEHYSHASILMEEVTGQSSGEQSGMTDFVKHYNEEALREQIADIELTDGLVTDIQVKTEKKNGKILSKDALGVELEGHGRIEFAEDYKGYRIYNTLMMCTASDLTVGYDFADFVLENGKICGILMVREAAMEYIRVLLKGSDYAGLFHEQLILTSDTDFTIEYGSYENRITEQYVAGEEITIDLKSQFLAEGRMKIIPNVLTGKVILKNLSRSQGTPSYRGQMELVLTEEGIVAVNEVSLEEYLYCVVPSEMPASYPDEALQAQAVCARTYAYGHMQKAGYPQYGAHVDDSTAYQVYNNILEQESTTTAVKETYGQLLFTGEGELANTYYYSTSCGVGTDANVWKTEGAKQLTYLGGAINRTRMNELLEVSMGTVEKSEGAEGQLGNVEFDKGEVLQEEMAFRDFILNTHSDDFEVEEGWYRWSYVVNAVNVERMLEVMQSRYQANSKLILTWKDGEYVSEPVEEFTKIRSLHMEKRGYGGVGDELILETDGNTYKVISEYNIRAVLNDGSTLILRQDGSEVKAPTLLPSAYFVITPVINDNMVTGYTLNGGGYGHGVGMSQNGAKNMAKAGYTSDQILTFFYKGCRVQGIYNK